MEDMTLFEKQCENNAVKQHRCIQNYPTIFHYTKYEKFESIIKSRTFRLSNHLKSNDKTEGILLINAVKCAVCQKIGTELFHSKKLNKKFDEAIHKLFDNPAYILSLTSKKDDQCLWDKYTDGGDGICFCINTEKLYRKIFRESLPYDIYEMNYVDYRKEPPTHRIIDLIVSWCLDDILLDSFESIDSIFENLCACAVDYKDKDTWAYENEVRVTCFDVFKSTQIKYDNNNREYVELSFNDENEINFDSLISEIIIGPKCKHTKEEVEHFLIQNGRKELSNALTISNVDKK